MERISREDCETIVENLNKLMQASNSEYIYEFSHRYDYYALDRISVVTGARSGSLLSAGTKREVYTAAWVAINVLRDAETKREIR